MHDVLTPTRRRPWPWYAGVVAVLASVLVLAWELTHGRSMTADLLQGVLLVCGMTITATASRLAATKR